MLFMLASETLGITSCCLNWPDIEDKDARIAEMLGLEPGQRVVMLIVLGYADPAGQVAYSMRSSIQELRRFREI